MLSLFCRRLGVPMMSLSMRRCVDWSLVTSCFVRVQDAHPHNIVDVIVPSKSRNLDFNGYVLLVSSCRSTWNLRHACDIRLSISVVW